MSQVTSAPTARSAGHPTARTLASADPIGCTVVMRRLSLRRGGPVILVVAVLALAGCTSKAPASASVPPAGNPSSGPVSPSGSSSPSSSPGNAVEFSVDGAGPYQLSDKLSDLQAAGQLAQVTAGTTACPDITTAQGTGTWTDLHLSFQKDGTLYLLVNESSAVPTPSGAWLGTTLPDLKKIYATVTNEDLHHGTDSAFLVITVSGRGILFTLDPGGRVTSMSAADANYLRRTFVGGLPYCAPS